MEHTLINADVMDGLKGIPDGSVHCVITSPPYWGLRDYGVEGQIGLEATPEEHVQKIVEVFREVRRVLRDDGTLWLNYGDCYTSGNRTGHGSKIGWKQQTNRGSDGLRDAPRLPLSCGLKPKDLVGMPWRVALALQSDGWYLRSDIIWSKPNPMPESVTDRPTKSHEYIFLLTKNQRYFYDAEAIREEVSGGAYSRGEYKGDLPKTSKPGHKIKNNSSFIHAIWDDPEKHPYKGKHSTADPQSAGRRIQLNHLKAREETGLHDGTRNARTVWTITLQARPESHFATFPDELARRCIMAGTSEYGCCPVCGVPYVRIVERSGGTTGKSYHPHDNDLVTGMVGGFPSKGYTREFKGWKPGCTCEAGEIIPCTVIDPFGGSGTVAKVARELNRSSILIEINPEYVEIQKRCLRAAEQLDTGVCQIKVIAIDGGVI